MRGLLEVECGHSNRCIPTTIHRRGLDTVAGHEIYSFLDGFSGYNQIRMHPADQEKTAYVTEWGCL